MIKTLATFIPKKLNFKTFESNYKSQYSQDLNSEDIKIELSKHF